jgi:hypothetical protein
LRVDQSGSIPDGWELTRAIVFSVAGRDGKYWATATSESFQERQAQQFDPATQSGPVVDRLLELLPGGKIEQRGKVEVNAQIVSFSGGRDGRSRVDCFRADRTKHTYRYP